MVDKVKTTKLEKSLSVKVRALSTEAKGTRKAYQMRAQTTNVFGEILKVYRKVRELIIIIKKLES